MLAVILLKYCQNFDAFANVFDARHNLDNAFTFNIFKMLKNVFKNVECWEYYQKCWNVKNVGTKIFSMQIILFFDKEFKKLLLTLIFTNIYSHLYLSGIIRLLTVTRVHFPWAYLNSKLIPIIYSFRNFSNKYWLCSFFSLTMAYGIGRNIALLKWSEK